MFVGRESGESAGVVEAVSELDDEDADVVAGGDHEAEEVILGFWQISVEGVHVFADLAELSDTVHEEGDRIAKFVADVV